MFLECLLGYDLRSLAPGRIGLRNSLDFLLLLFLLLIWPALVRADDAPAEAPATKPAAPVVSPQDLRDQVARRRAELAERIKRLSRQSEQDAGSANDLLLADLEHLKQVDLLLLQHEAALEFLAEQREELVAWTKDIEDLRINGIDEPRPYPVSLLDETEDQVDTETIRLQAAASELATARQLLEAAQEEHDQSQRERRRVEDEAEDSDDAETQQASALARKESELACALAAERVALRRAELDVRAAREEVCQARSVYYEEKAKRVEGHVAFTEAELSKRLADLTEFLGELQTHAKAIELRLEKWPAEEAAARQQLTAAAVSEEVLEEAQEAWQTTRRTLHERLAMKNQRLAEVRRFQDLVRWRFEAALGKSDLEELAEWRDTIDEYRDHLLQTESGLSRRVEELRLDLSSWQRRLVNLEDSDENLRIWIQAKVRETQALADDCEFSILQLKAGLRGSYRCLAEIDRHLPSDESRPWLEQLAEWWEGVWSYELAAVDDRPITVGKVTGALLYLVVGIFIARLVSRVAGRRLLPRVGMDRGASLAIQSITFYLLCGIGGFLALEFAHLPLTAFTFLGGAAAIGIGFGSQNILNNFISGLILLAEQPIRVGDVVELNNTYGTVEHIGMRSTRVRTGTNFELIVPNSKLLENNVVNLTLSDNSICAKVTASFAYGSPIADVKALLIGAAARNPKVLESPQPTVLVTNFGANAIEFELGFSMRIQSFGECRAIESEVREAIDEAFQEASSRLARPPRDASASSPAFDLRIHSADAERRAA